MGQLHTRLHTTSIISIITSWYSIKFTYEQQIEHTPFKGKTIRTRSAHLDLASATNEGRGLFRIRYKYKHGHVARRDNGVFSNSRVSPELMCSDIYKLILAIPTPHILHISGKIFISSIRFRILVLIYD